ncbi:GL15994 [Drosophila persimilis]|uniref:GL15994 n=1 Tax=Drosophila persimilis TaxID=7234 RepID=B4H9V5_DROPE|nr:GL15994 [Drosophila persimilis]
MALAMASKVFHLTNRPELLAQICYQIARSCIPQGGLRRRYSSTIDHFEGTGLAQMWLLRGRKDKAVINLESMRKLRPEHPFGLRLLSALYQSHRSLKKLQQAIAMLGGDYDSLILLAQIYEQMKLWRKTISSYQQANQVCSRQGLTVPVELIHNLGNALMKNKHPQQAIHTFDQALARENDYVEDPFM